uniref:Rho-GAP domain-containing protein n=1 Tax=Panagrellus redivivus TaxID=6233 RepID=A0A7E4V0K5_PANRE
MRREPPPVSTSSSISNTIEPEWIEIIDPKTAQHMFANLVTGNCAWEPPAGAPVKRMVPNQWWELFDQTTMRSYYYNPMTMKTIWIKPVDCEIIPLARLQLLKQNTELSNGGQHHPPSHAPHPSAHDQREPPPIPGVHHRSASSSSTPQSKRRTFFETHHNSASSAREPPCGNDFSYSAFAYDLGTTLPSSSFAAPYENGAGSSTQGTAGSTTSSHKTRAPSTCSVRSAASTKSRYNNCIQEMVQSQTATNESTPVLVRASMHGAYPRSYSPATSSLSSNGQSADILSQAASGSYAVSNREAALKASFTSGSTATVNKAASPSLMPGEKVEAFSKDVIKNALLDPSDKKLKKHAIPLFKLIMAYMGDRKAKDSEPEATALSILELRQTKPIITDEIFLQIMKQLTDNPRPHSVRKGWELLGIMLFFFLPRSSEIQQKLISFAEYNSDSLLDAPEVSVSQYAKHCLKRLQLPVSTMKPSKDAISKARFNIFHPSKFGATLEELMEMQGQVYPDLKIPWIESTLIKLIFESGGERSEGLFRLAADQEQVAAAITQLDQNLKPMIKDPHVAAVLLKQWLRQLPNPLIPDSMYDRCLQVCSDPDKACRLVDQLPAINRLVLSKLLHLLQQLCAEETVRITKMDVSNLAMVMAPNILRCDSQDPNVIFGNSRKEMEFTKTLIQHYDTSFVHSIE